MKGMLGTGFVLRRLADARRAEFEGRNARSRKGLVVHAVAPVETLGAVWPGLACHVGVYGGEANLEPADDPVTCLLCLRAVGAVDELEAMMDLQPTLF